MAANNYYYVSPVGEKRGFSEISSKVFAFAIVSSLKHETRVNPLFIADILESPETPKLKEFYGDLAIVRQRTTGLLPLKLDFMEHGIHVGFLKFRDPVTAPMAKAFVEEIDVFKTVTCLVVPAEFGPQEPTWGTPEDFCNLVYFYKWNPQKVKNLVFSGSLEDSVVPGPVTTSPDTAITFTEDVDEEDPGESVQYKFGVDEKNMPYISTIQRTTDEVNKSIETNFNAFQRFCQRPGPLSGESFGLK